MCSLQKVKTMDLITMSPFPACWTYQQCKHSWRGTYTSGSGQEIPPGLHWMGDWPLCSGRSVYCVDSWESFPHLHSKWSWSLPFHICKAMCVRRELACLSSGLSARQGLPASLGSSHLCFPVSAWRWADMASCQSGSRSFKRSPHECAQRLICSTLGQRCQRLPGRQRIGVCLHLISRLNPLAAGSLSFHHVASPKWEWLSGGAFPPALASIFKETNKIIFAFRIN